MRKGRDLLHELSQFVALRVAFATLTVIRDSITAALESLPPNPDRDPVLSAQQAEVINQLKREAGITDQDIAQAFGIDISVVSEFLA